MDQGSEIKPLGPPIGYINILDLALEDKIKKEAEKPIERNPLRPSSAGKCAREKAYEYMEYKGYAKYEKELITPELHRIFDLGHSVEYSLLRQFGFVEQFKVRYKQQILTFQKLASGELIEGSIDAVFYSPKWKCVADVKSKKDKFSAYYASKWDEDTVKYKGMKSVTPITENSFWVEDLGAFLEELNDAFFRMNFIQLNMYACNQFMKDRGIDHAAIIQYNKNDSRLREVRFKPSEAVYAQTMETDKNISAVIEESKDPEKVKKDYSLGSIKCAFCNFKTQCWGKDSNALKAFFNNLPEKKKWPKDTDRLGEDGDTLETLFAQRTKAEKQVDELEAVDSKIVKVLLENNVMKVRLNNKDIYEMKHLKSPNEHFAIRRSKL